MRDSRPQLLDVLFDDASAGSKGPLHNVQQRAVALLKLNRAVKGLLPAPLHPVPRREFPTGYFSARNGKCQLDDALALRTTRFAVCTTSANSTIIVVDRHQD